MRAADAAYGLLPDSAAIVVAVSGGPDSLALLDVLASLAPERGWRLHVAHLDHGLRPGSVGEAASVAALAEERGLPATVDARDVAGRAARSGRGIEDTARAVRYAFLAGVAARVGADRVATGHHADDQAETVLMNVLRGTGLDGLRGMAPSAEWPVDAATAIELEPERASDLRARGLPRLVRPLLGVWRVAIAAHAARRGLQPIHDPSNDDPTFLRNRLRHQVIPRLEAINPRLREALVRSAEAVAGDVAFVEAAVDAAWAATAAARPEGRIALDRAAWDAAHPAIQRRLLRRAVAALGGDLRALGLAHVEAVREAVAAGRADAAPVLPGGLRVSEEAGALVLGAARSTLPPPRLGPEPVPLLARVGPPPGEATGPADAVGDAAELALPGGWTMSAAVRARQPGDRLAPPDAWHALLDADAVRGDLAVRGRRPGDRLQPLGLGGRHRSIQDTLVDIRAPAIERDGWPLLVDDDGRRVLWVPGYRVDERVRIGPETRRVVAVAVGVPGRLR